MQHVHRADRRRRHRTASRTTLLIGGSVVLALGLSMAFGSHHARSASAPVRHPSTAIAPAHVVLYGDSLSTQAAPYLVWLYRLDHARATLTIHSFAGTALCDWVDRVVAELDAKPARTALALEFAGNSFTRCMQGSSRALGLRPGTAAYARAYATAMDRIRRAAAIAHVAVYWVEPPVLAPRRDGFDAIATFDGLARRHGFTVLPTSVAVAGDDGRWVRALPCAPWETTADGCRRDDIDVRDDQRLHFAFAADGYSAGAMRWALLVARLLP